MPTNLATVAVILLFVAPGFVYYSARFNAERQASEQPGALAERPSWTSDPLRQIVDSIIASTLLSGAAVGSLLFLRWIISWLIPDLALPSPGAWIAQGWEYVPDHWQWVVAAAAAELGIALTLARLLGSMQGQADYYTEELLLQRSDIVRSHAVVQLRSGTIYSGVVPGRPRHKSMLGEELILFAPIDVRTSSGTRTLRSQSIALPKSEIASLTVTDGPSLLTKSRLYLYSDAVPPPWSRPV
jgi:hypothetical protein